MRKLLYLLAFLMVSVAGAQDYKQVVSSHLNSKKQALGLTANDISQIAVVSDGYSKSMDVQNVYVTQQYNGIDVFNSVSGFAIRNGAVLSEAMKFEANVQNRINTTSPSVTPSLAVTKAANALGLISPNNLELLSNEGNTYVYGPAGISLNDIPVKLVYLPMEDSTMRLAWDLSIYLLDASHYYSVRIDAVSGQMLEKTDWVVSCTFEHDHTHHVDGDSILFKNNEAPALTMGGGAQYNVFPIPFRSPLDGDPMVVTGVESATASPFGWHDTDGAAGAEFTITRGNNVHAQEDQNGNNGTGYAPDGGPDLNFDFPFGLPQPPEDFLDASITNLFYINNIMHDMSYYYGFDEENGNFQANNYGNGGAGNDYVFADSQDGSGQNNATFGTPPDGQNPRMTMFLWDPSGLVELLTINNGPLAGGYTAVAANYGAPMPSPALTADLVVVEDDDSGDSEDPNDACDPITNGGDLNGKIAVIRRGACEFGFKSLAAQNEGAVAVIMVNNVPGDPILMGGGAVGAQVTIPCLMVDSTDGEALIAELLGGGTVNGSIEEVPLGFEISGDLDNEVIAHEYGHGISNRLTAGPTIVSCLNNNEQMGEGWSDYWGIWFTMKEGDQGTDARGIGTYDAGQGPDGSGIRDAPYSTDFAVNDFTYADINSVSIPHGVGFVWCTMLWDMTWAMVDEYGFDTDFYEGTGGNNLAMQLVMDGMKLQPCAPGFVDGRDAILMADELANGGENKCMIWEAFANRGLGFSADQGISGAVGDETEAFDLPAECDSLGIGDFDFGVNFSIYPNPSNGLINIESKVSLGETNVSIYDMNGRMVYSQDMELGNLATVDATSLMAGIYIVKIDGGNYTHTAKVIIQ